MLLPVFAPLKQVSESGYITTSEVVITSTTFTHSGVNIGEADSTRLIVVTSSTYSVGPTITGITLDGNAMTKAVNNLSASGLTDVAIFYLAWPTGATADFVVSKGGSNSTNNHLSIHVLYGLSSNTPYITSTSDVDPAALSANVTSGSFGVAVAQTGGGTYTITWVGLNEDYEINNWSANAKNIGVASQLFTATESPRTITADYSTATHYAAAFAAWR